MATSIVELRTPEVVHIGMGAIERIGDEVGRLGGKTALIVTDPGIAKTDIVAKVETLLRDAGVGTATFAEVEPEPPIAVVDRALACLKDEDCDVLVGVGGGSSMDVTKVCSVLATNEGAPADYFGVGLIPKPGLPKVLVPTTSGTGSEVTPIAILSDVEAKVKKGIVSPMLYGDVAIVDPELTFSVPPHVTAATGMDALTHAVEAFISLKACPISDGLALEAMRMISANLAAAYDDGQNAAAREAMSIASMMAGMCLPLAGAAAVHALAYPLGGEFHLSHGESNTLMLPFVLEYNVPACADKMARMADALGEDTSGLTTEAAARRAVDAMRSLATRVGMPLSLSHYGIPEDAIPRMAEAAAKITRLMDNNPRPAGAEEIAGIYRAAL